MAQLDTQSSQAASVPAAPVEPPADAPAGPRFPRLAAAVLLVPLLAVAVVSFVFIRVHSGDGANLLGRQQQSQALTPASVARVVRVAPDPVTNQPGRSASCASLGSGLLRNPWRCTISYPSGRRIEYLVTITASGSYTGEHEIIYYQGRRTPDSGEIRGCCIAVP
jgi:hypothetical protein